MPGAAPGCTHKPLDSKIPKPNPEIAVTHLTSSSCPSCQAWSRSLQTAAGMWPFDLALRLWGSRLWVLISGNLTQERGRARCTSLGWVQEALARVCRLS